MAREKTKFSEEELKQKFNSELKKLTGGVHLTGESFKNPAQAVDNFIEHLSSALTIDDISKIRRRLSAVVKTQRLLEQLWKIGERIPQPRKKWVDEMLEDYLLLDKLNNREELEPKYERAAEEARGYLGALSKSEAEIQAEIHQRLEGLEINEEAKSLIEELLVKAYVARTETRQHSSALRRLREQMARIEQQLQEQQPEKLVPEEEKDSPWEEDPDFSMLLEDDETKEGAEANESPAIEPAPAPTPSEEEQLAAYKETSDLTKPQLLLRRIRRAAARFGSKVPVIKEFLLEQAERQPQYEAVTRVLHSAGMKALDSELKLRQALDKMIQSKKDTFFLHGKGVGILRQPQAQMEMVAFLEFLSEVSLTDFDLNRFSGEISNWNIKESKIDEIAESLKIIYDANPDFKQYIDDRASFFRALLTGETAEFRDAEQEREAAPTINPENVSAVPSAETAAKATSDDLPEVPPASAESEEGEKPGSSSFDNVDDLFKWLDENN